MHICHHRKCIRFICFLISGSMVWKLLDLPLYFMFRAANKIKIKFIGFRGYSFLNSLISPHTQKGSQIQTANEVQAILMMDLMSVLVTMVRASFFWWFMIIVIWLLLLKPGGSRTLVSYTCGICQLASSQMVLPEAMMESRFLLLKEVRRGRNANVLVTFFF